MSIWADNVLKHHVPAFDQSYPAYLANLSSIIAALHERCGRITHHKGTCMNKHGFYAFVFVTQQQVMHFQSLSLRQVANMQANNYNHKTKQVWKWPQWVMQTYRSLSSCLITRWHESAVEFMLKVRSRWKNKTSFITKPFSWIQRANEEVLVCVYSVNISHSLKSEPRYLEENCRAT